LRSLRGLSRRFEVFQWLDSLFFFFFIPHISVFFERSFWFFFFPTSCNKATAYFPPLPGLPYIPRTHCFSFFLLFTRLLNKRSLGGSLFFFFLSGCPLSSWSFGQSKNGFSRLLVTGDTPLFLVPPLLPLPGKPRVPYPYRSFLVMACFQRLHSDYSLISPPFPVRETDLPPFPFAFFFRRARPSFQAFSSISLVDPSCFPSTPLIHSGDLRSPRFSPLRSAAAAGFPFPRRPSNMQEISQSFAEDFFPSSFPHFPGVLRTPNIFCLRRLSFLLSLTGPASNA